MSSDSSPSHITNVAVLAWNVYEAYQQSVGDFKALSGEVLLLHSILRQAHEEFEKIALSGQQKRSLQLLISESEDLLKELLLNFESLPMSSRRTRDRMRGRSVDAGSIGIRINKQVTLLNTFHNFIVRCVYLSFSFPAVGIKRLWNEWYVAARDEEQAPCSRSRVP